jgi:hypothetical protein
MVAHEFQALAVDEDAQALDFLLAALVAAPRTPAIVATAPKLPDVFHALIGELLTSRGHRSQALRCV